MPILSEIKNLKSKLLAIRLKILNLIDIFAEADFSFKLKTPLVYAGLKNSNYSFLEGVIKTSSGATIEEINLGEHFKAVIIPYSQARGFDFDGKFFLVGALARLNLNQENLNQKTKESTTHFLKMFPSDNLFHNNLAQAIEILHAIDNSCEIID
ncbi:MAG: cytosolic NiFe-hydrogenase, alpha subunit, partial [uncultured bacterium]